MEYNLNLGVNQILDLNDNNFNRLNKTIIRGINEILENTNIMIIYID